MKRVKAFSIRTIIILLICVGILVLFGMEMGFANFFSTAMKTSHDLLLNTVFFIMAISVLAGAAGSFMSEFGIISLFNKLLAPIIKIFWGLPGAAAMGALSTYISDNPAIIALAKDNSFIQYFKEYEKPALTNLGTSFGMGLIITAFMTSKGFFQEAMIGNLGAVIGSVVSTRIMLHFTKKYFKPELKKEETKIDQSEILNYRYIRDGNVFNRLLSSLLDGGKNGLEIGFQIIPGVLIICTFVLMVTFGNNGFYTGGAYEGIPILPALGKLIFKPLQILFGFSSPDAIAFPITSLGAVGAAIGLVPKFLNQGLIHGNDIAVFTAMGMCWSGYLSTHIAMMDTMGYRELTSKAILSHTIGGLIAGISAHYLFLLIL